MEPGINLKKELNEIFETLKPGLPLKSIENTLAQLTRVISREAIRNKTKAKHFQQFISDVQRLFLSQAAFMKENSNAAALEASEKSFYGSLDMIREDLMQFLEQEDK